MFYSIQGEGITVGQPAFFIRTAYCNLNCHFCDSKYSWGNGKEFSIEDIAGQSLPYSHIVITGGEPLLQREDLYRLLHALEGKYIEIETNGTIKPCQGIIMRTNHFNVSVKLSNSKVPEVERIVPEVIQLYTQLKAFFKFVISTPENLKEVQDLISQYNIPAQRVILMAEGTSHEEIRGKAQWIIEECKKNGFMYSPRLHIDIWGVKRGV